MKVRRRWLRGRRREHCAISNVGLLFESSRVELVRFELLVMMKEIICNTSFNNHNNSNNNNKTKHKTTTTKTKKNR